VPTISCVGDAMISQLDGLATGLEEDRIARHDH
jgi:hypothetical protein